MNNTAKPKIILGNKVVFQWNEINPNHSSLNEYESRLLQFCQDWQKGKNDFFIQTSGSTGVPKTICIHADKMTQSAQMTIQALGLRENDTAFICLNTDYIAGKMMLVRSIVARMNMYIIPPVSNPLSSLNGNECFDFAAFVPLQLETMILESPEKISILNSMKAIIIGGAGISVRQEKLFQQIEVPIYHTFGMTETLSHIALRRINGNAKEGFYRVLNNIHISQDERGCLVIRSPFNEVPLTTNDVVELIDDRSFKWLGRADNIINSGGIKLYLEIIEKKIEELFLQLNITNRFFLYGLPDETLGQRLILIIEGKLINDTIQKDLTNCLGKYERPKEIYFLDKFEETVTGKVARNQTAAKLGNITNSE